MMPILSQRGRKSDKERALASSSEDALSTNLPSKGKPKDQKGIYFGVPAWIYIFSALTLLVCFGVYSIYLALRTRLPPSPCSGICSLDDLDPKQACTAVTSFPRSALYVTRVPKTGGEALAQVLMEISKTKGGFKPWYFDEWINGVPSGGFDMKRTKKQLSDEEYEKLYVGNLRKILQDSTRPYPLAAHGHAFFLSPDKADAFSIQEPPFSALIVLRDPIRRLTSQYNYDETLARNDKFKSRMLELHQGKSFTECALDASCRERNEFKRWCSIQTQYACGFSPECAHPIGREGLETAIRNIESNYAAVGILEHFDTSLQLFAAMLPFYFEGAGSLTRSVKGVNKGEYRPTQVSQEVIEALKDDCEFDTALYAAALRRYHDDVQICLEE